ncbi:hypothetical protein [Aeromicrobium stalagmiti]|uniref:hypothetical protein n=1 Tax=Aeromicrobium stalagmiti TaxID=2738988 RepID=UPI00156A1462|nr:hypothetical protein [Aeromicrobium stalagmiti]NRQ49223.1 hypothetical protein [Aeromicrobium stalagmiti]
MKLSRVLASALAVVVLAGCGSEGGSSTGGAPFTLPVGKSSWDAVTAPAWLNDGTLHVGDQTVRLGKRVDEFVLGATGVYWLRGGTLWFTDTAGDTQKVHTVGQSNVAVSADRSVLATVDQSRGPTDEYGTHVIQAAAFDTRTGQQLYRTPDKAPDKGADLTDLYSEIMPLLHGVSDERLFFENRTIDLRDGSSTPSRQDSDGLDVYEGFVDTVFPDGYRVSLSGEGKTRQLSESSMFAIGRQSPDRTTLFDVGTWPTDAVVYDARSGRQSDIGAPWDHFTLVGWQDEDTFFGVAERIDEDNVMNVLRARQVVTCELRTLACDPVSPVIRTDDDEDGQYPTFLTEGDASTM